MDHNLGRGGRRWAQEAKQGSSQGRGHKRRRRRQRWWHQSKGRQGGGWPTCGYTTNMPWKHVHPSPPLYSPGLIPFVHSILARPIHRHRQSASPLVPALAIRPTTIHTKCSRVIPACRSCDASPCARHRHIIELVHSS